MNDRELGLLIASITFLASTLYLQWAFYGLLKRLEAMELSVLKEMKVRQANDERMSERLFSVADHIKAQLEKLATPRQPVPKPDSYYIELFKDSETSEWGFGLYRVNQSDHSDNWSAMPLDESDHGQKFEWHPTAQDATASAVALLEQVKKADAELYAKWAEEDKEEEEREK